MRLAVLAGLDAPPLTVVQPISDHPTTSPVSISMPELPEVETMVRGVRAAFEGHRLADVSLCDCHCRPILMQPDFPRLRELCIGQKVSSVTRRAKRILIQLESGAAFVIEPRMTGLMLLSDPPDESHLRFEWKLTQGRKRHSVWFWDRRGLGTLRLLDPDQLAAHLGPEKLGPDALEMTADEWVARLRRTDRPVKVALLDQKLVAGIGNLYASEILHRSGIHPEVPASRLTGKRIAKIHAATLEILHEATRYEGSTLGDGTYRNALNKDGSYQNKHRVYARHGQPCVTCGNGEIQRIVQAQRSTFFCARCQKR
ncbi:bifunctional DNA-formamidopyrimidine glycosylase/DNA-(apurinic or apyrimidinic site) lyase [Planctomicrobium piriforme]|uniref:Formamidopyrimidine-DNA glycosylase n=1 Tax=Planctomicrobium piriforme TaxID=1576369 RepID=A0A1I3C0Q9_9PLAN|nr:bifunctional DNA-formamidopyrimidine glycosylase/DNA-(apurinic or apyrimidinic site) lyase [Planctomicrobium piriforme]SFH68050.1 formamidopyrimidine-DNA glycosylase [Planctomicrobium piriforme]